MLSSIQERAALMLALGKSNVETGKELGLAPETVCRYKKQPEFEARLNQHRLDFMEQTKDRLRCASLEAIEVLSAIMKNHRTAPQIKIRAASTILDYSCLKNGAMAYMGIGYTDVQAIANSNALSESLHKSKSNENDLFEEMLAQGNKEIEAFLAKMQTSPKEQRAKLEAERKILRSYLADKITRQEAALLTGIKTTYLTKSQAKQRLTDIEYELNSLSI